MARVPITRELLPAAWTLGDDVSARDALYVTTATAVEVELITTDRRLARSMPDRTADLVCFGP